MANPYKNDFIDVDIERGTVSRSFTQKTIGEGDNVGDIFGVNIYKNGNAYDLLNCSCVGYFIRSDGDTVVIAGQISGNRAYVSLPASCYVKEGVFSLAIKVSGTGYTGTIRVVDGTVINTSTGSFIDPGSVVPDLSELTAIIERAETAAENIDDLSITSEQITGTRYKIKVTKS